jgi:hypothetical protein
MNTNTNRKGEKPMCKSEAIIIKLEFDRSIRYLDGRKEKLTTEECLQELGHLRLFIYNMTDKSVTK